MVAIAKFVKAHPLYVAAAAAFGGYLLLRPEAGRRLTARQLRRQQRQEARRAAMEEGVVGGYGSAAGISSGPRVYYKPTGWTPRTVSSAEWREKYGGQGPRVIRAPFGLDPVFWVTITNWDDEAERKYRLGYRVGDMLRHGIVRVTVIASVPVVPGTIKIGPTTYAYCNGPGNVKAIVSTILKVTTAMLNQGVQSAAPQWSAVSKIVGNIINKIPSLVERSRQKKWAEWRQGLDATMEFASRDWTIAKKTAAMCRIWKYEGPWTGTNIDLPLIKVIDDFPTIEIPWKEGSRELTRCLDGEAPSVTISAGGQLRVTLFKPEVGPPGACEVRYDIAGSVASD